MDKLDTVREALEFYADYEATDESNGAYYIEQEVYVMDSDDRDKGLTAKQALTALKEHTDRLESEELVEKVRLAITKYNEFGSRCKTAARAAIKIIKG